MTEVPGVGTPVEAPLDRRLALLLSMAMFVLVVDTSMMNVSISAVVHDLGTTVSGVQSAIALEALVSAAFILIGSKVGDLIGRKRAYVLGLLGYAIGAGAMTVTQSLTSIIIFWAVIGGIGASLLLPAMQSLIHGNFEGGAQKRVYAMVGAAAAVAAAVGPLLGGFITTYLSWRVAFGLEVVVIAVVLSGIKRVRDVPYTGPRQIDLVGADAVGRRMGGLVLGILVWQEGGDAVVELMLVGAAALSGLVYWLDRRKREGKATLLDPGLFRSKLFRFGVSGQLLQQIALGGTMIVLPIYLQMVLEYNAMEAGLSLAPLSLTMFAVALLAGRKAGHRRPAAVIRMGFSLSPRPRAPGPDRPSRHVRLVAGGPARRRRDRPRPPRLTAQQLHALAHLGGAGQRGGRRELGGRVLRPVLRPRVRGRDHARGALGGLHTDVGRQRRARHRSAAAGGDALEDDAELMTNTQLEEQLAGQPADVRAEIIRINTDAAARPADRPPDPDPRQRSPGWRTRSG